MLDKIHQSKIRELIARTDGKGNPQPFAIDYVKLSTGECVHHEGCTLSSWHEKGGTVNILIPGEAGPRKLRRCLITAIDGIRVYF